MLSIDEIEGSLDDEFRDLLVGYSDGELGRLLSDPGALTRLRPASITSRRAREMVRAELARRAEPAPAPCGPSAPSPPPARQRRRRRAEPARVAAESRPPGLALPPPPCETPEAGTEGEPVATPAVADASPPADSLPNPPTAAPPPPHSPNAPTARTHAKAVLLAVLVLAVLAALLNALF